MGKRDCCETEHGVPHTQGCENEWKPKEGSCRMGPLTVGTSWYEGVDEKGCAPSAFTATDEQEYTVRGNGVYHYDLCIALCLSEETAQMMLRGLLTQQAIARVWER